MKTNLYTQITLNTDVKALLDSQKAGLSASLYISSMLNYFEENGINPTKMSKGKNGVQMLQGIEQIKKMIRAIERDKIDLLCERVAGNIPNNSNDYDNLLRSYNTLKRENERLVEENKKIRNSGSVVNTLTKEQLLKAKREGAEELRYIINYYFNEENAGIYFARTENGQGSYFVTRNFLDKFIEKAKSIIENMK